MSPLGPTQTWLGAAVALLALSSCGRVRLWFTSSDDDPGASPAATVVMPAVVASKISAPRVERHVDAELEETEEIEQPAPAVVIAPLSNGRVRDAQEYFDTLDRRFQAGASKNLHAVFQFDLTGPNACAYHVAVDDGTMKLETGHASKADVTLGASSEDYVRVVNGELSGVRAVMSHKMKVGGNLTLARRMQQLFPPGRADK